MKTKNINQPKDGQLRVWHIPQVPMNTPFYVDVKSVKEARKVLDIIVKYDNFQFEHHIKPDYSDASGLEVFEDGQWCEWYDDDGNDILEGY